MQGSLTSQNNERKLENKPKEYVIKDKKGARVVAEQAHWKLPLVLIITFWFNKALGISIILTFTYKVNTV